MNEIQMQLITAILGMNNSSEKSETKESSRCVKLEDFIGENVFIRTVTHIQLGKLVGLTDTEYFLEDACWIADTGRYAACLKTGKVSEAEPFPDGVCFGGRGAIIDGCKWNHELIRTVVE